MKRVKKQLIQWFIFIILFFVLILSGFFTYIAVQPVYNYFSIKSEFEKIRQPNFYAVLNDRNPYELAKGYDKEKLIDFFNYFIETNIQKYIMYSYLPDVNEKGIEVQKRFANMIFFNLYDFDLFEGRTFIETDFVLDDENEIPIIVGYNLKDIYSLGNTYTFYEEDGEEFKVRVVGVLKKGANYPSLQDVKECLDNSYILPISDDFQKKYFTLSDYDLAISTTIFYTENISELNDLINEANKTDFFSLDIISVEDVLEEYENYFIFPRYKTIAIFGGISFVLLILVGLDISFIIKSNKNKVVISNFKIIC